MFKISANSSVNSKVAASLVPPPPRQPRPKTSIPTKMSVRRREVVAVMAASPSLLVAVMAASPFLLVAIRAASPSLLVAVMAASPSLMVAVTAASPSLRVAVMAASPSLLVAVMAATSSSLLDSWISRDRREFSKLRGQMCFQIDYTFPRISQVMTPSK